jgi:hypothetical protein
MMMSYFPLQGIAGQPYEAGIARSVTIFPDFLLSFKKSGNCIRLIKLVISF